VHLRSYAIGVMPKVPPETTEAGAPEPPAAALVDRRPVVFASDGGATEADTPFYDREGLRAGNVIVGPAVIEQLDSTTVVPPGMPARVGADGAIIIDCAPQEA
jgi:N-methylhydantoinase A